MCDTQGFGSFSLCTSSLSSIGCCITALEPHIVVRDTGSSPVENTIISSFKSFLVMNIAHQILQGKVNLTISICYDYFFLRTQDHVEATLNTLEFLVKDGLCTESQKENGAGTVRVFTFKYPVNVSLDLNCQQDVFNQMEVDSLLKLYEVELLNGESKRFWADRIETVEKKVKMYVNIQQIFDFERNPKMF